LIADARKIREPRPASRKSPSQNREPRNVGRHRWRKNRELAAQKQPGPFHIGSINVDLILKTAIHDPRTTFSPGGGFSHVSLKYLHKILFGL